MAVDTETAEECASEAAEAIRRLNHRTMRWTELPVPAVYTTTADLATMAHRLVQACSQLSATLHDRLLLGNLRADDGTDPAIAIFEARDELAAAAGMAAELGGALERTQNAIAIISDDAGL